MKRPNGRYYWQVFEQSPDILELEEILWTDRLEDGRHANMASLFLRHLRGGSLVVDMGCGTARWAEVISPVGKPHPFVYSGYDKSSNVLNRARARRPDLAGGHLVAADITNMPLPDQSVDCAMLISVVKHFPPEEWMIPFREAMRISRDLVALTAIVGPETGEDGTDFFHSFVSRDEFEDEIERGGFEILSGYISEELAGEGNDTAGGYRGCEEYWFVLRRRS